MSTSSFSVREHILPAQYIREYPGATLENQEDTLKLHIKQYIPKDDTASKSGAVTIIGAHANGFPKELYEPLWEDLFHALKRRNQSISSIWISDVAHQGESGAINEDKLGNDPSWADHPRDLLHMINHFRSEMPRPLIGIGHSLGGNNMVNLSLIHPRLLSSVILIDPVIQKYSSKPPPEISDSDFTRLSTFRRDAWPSRSVAAESFKQSPFYQSWDPRVFDRWITYGLRDLPTATYPDPSQVLDAESLDSQAPVTLKTTKHQEVFTFMRPNFNGIDQNGNQTVNRQTHPDLDLDDARDTFPFYRPEAPRTMLNLPYLRPSTLYIFGGQSPLSSPAWRKDKLEKTGTGAGGSGGAAEGRVKEVVFEEAGHLLPFEITSNVADAGGEWIAAEARRWRVLEDEWRREWDAKSREEKTMITEEWKIKVGGDPRGQKL